MITPPQAYACGGFFQVFQSDAGGLPKGAKKAAVQPTAASFSGRQTPYPTQIGPGPVRTPSIPGQVPGSFRQVLPKHRPDRARSGQHSAKHGFDLPGQTGLDQI